MHVAHVNKEIIAAFLLADAFSVEMPKLKDVQLRVDLESFRFRFKYFSQIQIWTPATNKLPVSSIKYQDENNNR